jgi:Amt family ammonium transporter
MEQTIYMLWLLSMGSLIFFMQAGFFFLEGGQVRSRDVSNVMMKMIGHMGVGITVFLLFGFAIKQFAWPLAAMPTGGAPWNFFRSGDHSLAFFVSLMFALVSCAIPSGSFSGRMKFSAYLVFAAVYVGILYPIFAYILWNGPLARLGVQDYAGSLGVHAVGGIMGLVGAKFVGKRMERSEPHDVPMMGFGAILLMFCWFGFNLGSVPSYDKLATDLPIVAINTLAAIGGGILGSLLITRLLHGKTHAVITPNGGLAGAVAICSGVHLFHPLMALAVGAVAGAQIPLTSKFLTEKLGIDDPCDVGAVHTIPGLLGGLSCALAGIGMPAGYHGYTISPKAQVIGTLAALSFGIVAGTAFFAILKFTMGLRVDESAETNGLDVSQHGVASYPDFFRPIQSKRTSLHVLSGVRVDEVMRDVPTVHPQDMLDMVHELMVTSEIFCLPVVNEKSEFVGVISNSDLARISPAERKNVRVAAVFTRDAFFAYPDQTVHEIAEEMRQRRLANFPVLARQNKRQLIGMITKSEIVRAYQRMAMETAV